MLQSENVPSPTCSVLLTQSEAGRLELNTPAAAAMQASDNTNNNHPLGPGTGFGSIPVPRKSIVVAFALLAISSDVETEFVASGENEYVKVQLIAGANVPPVQASATSSNGSGGNAMEVMPNGAVPGLVRLTKRVAEAPIATTPKSIGVGLAAIMGAPAAASPRALSTICMFGNPLTTVEVGAATPQPGARSKDAPVSPRAFEPMKKEWPAACPSGVNTSTTNWAPEGTVALTGTVKMDAA